MPTYFPTPSPPQTTCRDMISRAFRWAKVYGPGDIIANEDYNDALLTLCAMLDTWSADELFVYNTSEQTFPLTAGVPAYTIGPGGTFNTVRPLDFDYMFTRDANNIDRIITKKSEAEFAQIVLKNIGNIFPTIYKYDTEYPLATITFFPYPQAGLSLIMGTWSPITSFATLDDIFSFPPGYLEPMTYSLAERLGFEYEKEISPAASRMIAVAIGRLKARNSITPDVACEFGGSDAGATTIAQFLAGQF